MWLLFRRARTQWVQLRRFWHILMFSTRSFCNVRSLRWDPETGMLLRRLFLSIEFSLRPLPFFPGNAHQFFLIEFKFPLNSFHRLHLFVSTPPFLTNRRIIAPPNRLHALLQHLKIFHHLLFRLLFFPFLPLHLLFHPP